MSGPWIDFKKLRKQIPIEAVMRFYGIEVRPARGNRHVGPCPLPSHGGKRKSASFCAKLAHNVWQCLDCKARGNALTLAVHLEGLDPEDPKDFRTVALKLQHALCMVPRGHSPGAGTATRLPAPPRERSAPAARPPAPDSRPNLPVLVNPPLDFALKDLDPGHPYLRERGFHRETVERFGLGYCSRGLMRGRFVIPLHDPDGRLAGYAGRIVDDSAVGRDTPRYLLPGTRERNGTVLRFDKSLLLYNLHRIEVPAADLVVVQGFPSAWWLAQWGYLSVVSLMGPDCSEEQTRLIAQGNTVLLLDGTGAVTQVTRYDAFGNVVTQTGTSDNDRLRNTKERSTVLGLDNDGMRYYDPRTGRYVSRDPSGYGDGLNVYLSDHDDPVNKVDPLGLNSKDDYDANHSSPELPGMWPQADGVPASYWASDVPQPITTVGPQLRPGPGIPIEPPSRMAGWVSFGLDMTPGVGNVKSAAEFLSGHDGVTGERLGWVARTIGLAGVILPEAKGPLGRVVRWIGGHADEAKDVTRMLEMAKIKAQRAASAAEDGVASAVVNAPEGGAYRELSTAGGRQRHHMPADSVSPLSTNEGPAIEMDFDDHVATSSHGWQGRAGAEYRAEISNMLQTGNWRGAMATEIRDVRRAAQEVSGDRTKYNGAVKGMLDYAYDRGLLNKAASQ